MTDQPTVSLEWFTRQIAELGDRPAAWFIHPFQVLMSMDFIAGRTDRLVLVDTGVLTGHNQDHALVHDDMPINVLTIPPIQVEVSTPEGPRAYLIDGNNRINLLAARGVPRIPVYHVEEVTAQRFRFTDEEAVILADESSTPEVLNAKEQILLKMAMSLNDLNDEAQRTLDASPYSVFPLPRPLLGLVTPDDLPRVQRQAQRGAPTLGTAHLEAVLRQKGHALTVSANPANTPAPGPARKVPAWEAAKARKKARKKK